MSKEIGCNSGCGKEVAEHSVYGPFGRISISSGENDGPGFIRWGKDIDKPVLALSVCDKTQNILVQVVCPGNSSGVKQFVLCPTKVAALLESLTVESK